MVRRARIPRGSQQTVESTVFPASSGGIDARAPSGNTPIENCIYTFNLMPDEYGMVVRPGFREWNIDIESTTGLGVTTMIAFKSSIGLSSDRLFGVTNEGIWDVTTFDTTPTLKVAFGTTTSAAGHGVYTHYTDQSGADFLLYADGTNGLYEYTQSTDTWAISTAITGPVIADIAFVVVHKQRLWLVEVDSTSAWYLPVASKAGAATEFFFGSKFPHGGNLRALFNWSVDGGLGVDDFLVAISGAGDVIPYQGDDPSSADTWEIRGTYFIGELPRGRKVASEYSGDLYLLSTYGLIAMSDLLRGVDSKNVAADSLTFKIAKLLRAELFNTIALDGWEPKFLPTQGNLVINTPRKDSNARAIQFTLSLASEGWGLWRDVPMLSMEEWNNKVYFGTSDNKVFVMDVERDNITITPPVSGQNGDPIKFSSLTSTQRMGSPSQNKIAQYVRPDFLAKVEPSFQTRVLFNYSIGEVVQDVDDPTDQPGLWDISKWDEAVWGRSTAIGFNTLQGASGIGRTMAIAITGKAYGDTRLVSYDVMWTTGGPT